MTVSRALRRLLRIRELEEEQGRIALEAAIGDLSRLTNEQAATVARGQRGRRLVGSSAVTGEFTDRLAGLEETRAAERLALALAPRIANANEDVGNRREDYLAKRVERRQAETLIEEAEARDAIDAERKSQQALDDWFRNRLHRSGLEARQSRADAPANVAYSDACQTESDEGRET
jgi:hypothetical protein